jgi:hypothetical protein
VFFKDEVGVERASPGAHDQILITVLSMSGIHSDERSGLSFVLVTRTASVQFSKFAAGPCQLLS